MIRKALLRGFRLGMLGMFRRGNPSSNDPQGQILAGHRFGEWISLLAGSARCEKIVEIGTWKGLGSTRLLAEALEFRPNVHALSI